MALSLSTLVQQVKRKTQYGDINTTTDQATADVIHYINKRSLRLWRRFPWHYSVVTFTLTLVAGTVDYVLGATVGDIVAIDNGNGGNLTRRTIKRWLQWHNNASGSDNPGTPSDYMRMGLDANKNIMLKVWPSPASGAALPGWGKKRFVRYSVSDLAANTDIAYFPDEALDVIEEGVLADIYEAQAKPIDAQVKNKYFEEQLDAFVKEEADVEDSEEESAAPDYFTFHKRKRGGTTIS